MSFVYSFVGKRVLITGGARGIGRQLIERFVVGGAEVFTIDKNKNLIEKLREDHPSVKSEIVDLADWKETRNAIESFGEIDHLVNNAVTTRPQAFLDITEESATS